MKKFEDMLDVHIFLVLFCYVFAIFVLDYMQNYRANVYIIILYH